MGVGAGYSLEVKDLKLNFDGIKLKRSEDSHGPRIDFTVPIKKERYEFEAEHPYWGFKSEALMSGSVKGVIREDDCDVFSLEGNLNVFSDDNEVKGLIKNDAENHGLSIEDIFSGGWCWCKPQRDWGFDRSNIWNGVIQTGENSISYTSANIDSEEMAAKVDFVYEHQDEENFYEDYEEYLDEEWTFNEPDDVGESLDEDVSEKQQKTFGEDFDKALNDALKEAGCKADVKSNDVKKNRFAGMEM